MDAEEMAFLNERYGHLSSQQLTALMERLARVRSGEMVAYYIQRYGFYEGHTDYRADPLAIASVFGLRSLREIEAAFPGRLHEMLTRLAIPMENEAGVQDEGTLEFQFDPDHQELELPRCAAATRHLTSVTRYGFASRAVCRWIVSGFACSGRCRANFECDRLCRTTG